MSGALAGLLVAAALAVATSGSRPERRLVRPAGHGPDRPAGARRRPLLAVRRIPTARGPRADPALVMDLLAAALRSGAPVPTALAVVAAAVGGADGDRLGGVAQLMSMGTPSGAAWAGAGQRWAPLARCLALAESSGAPTADLLRRAARRERTDRAQRQAAAAQRLGVRVLLPMGLCALPAFAALGVVPVVLALAATVVGG